jgi:tetratricopeptide (TPR) repeat protein
MLKLPHIRHVLLSLFLILAGCGEQEKVTKNPTDRSKAATSRALTQRAIDKQVMGTLLTTDPTVYTSTRLWRSTPEVLAYKRTLEIDPRNTNARMGLGAVYAKSVLNNLAVEEYLKVAEANPGDAEIHFKVALEYGYLQRLLQAAEYYQKTIAINPEYLQAHLNLAIVYERMKEWDKALREIAVSLQLGKETHNQQAVSIAERKLAFFKGRMNLTAKEMKRRTEPPFE